ncbi:RES family NAD+ phosphorylase [Algoriphagus namhaensis]
MRVFRLARKKYPIELSGKGAALFGNRWNSKGTEIIYTAESRALAMAEVAVHLSIANLPSDFVMLEIEVPDEVSKMSVELDRLSGGWNSFPHLRYTQLMGDDFILRGRSCILQVPSAVVPGDYNYLINPAHSDFHKISIVGQQDFPFDRRLFKEA